MGLPSMSAPGCKINSDARVLSEASAVQVTADTCACGGRLANSRVAIMRRLILALFVENDLFKRRLNADAFGNLTHFSRSPAMLTFLSFEFSTGLTSV